MLKGEFEFGFAVDWMRKDLGDRASKKARSNGALGSDVDRRGRPVLRRTFRQRGGNRWDTSSLIEILRDKE